MIFETISILGGAMALIAVQPPLRRLFPEKPKQTVWEEFWADAAGRHKHWDSCGVECDSRSSDIADHVLAQAKKPWQMPDSLAVLTKKAPPVTPSSTLHALKTEPRKDMTWMNRDHEIRQRQKVTEEAQRLGKQVYLDHATNEYRMRDKLGESQLAANERALRDGMLNSFRQQLGVDLAGYQHTLQQANYWLPDPPLSTAAQGKPPVSSANEDMLRALGVWKDEDGTTLRQL
jgi:hypothetical protein